jgi:hypothetical protein
MTNQTNVRLRFLIAAATLAPSLLCLSARADDRGDADNPPNEPFQSFICLSEGSSFETCPAADTTFTIPATTFSGAPVKRFVFEHLSGICQSGSGIAINQVNFQIPSGGVAHVLVPVNVTAYPALENDYAFSQQVRLYASPGQSVRMGIARIGGPNDFCFMSFSGYFVTH